MWMEFDNLVIFTTKNIDQQIFQHYFNLLEQFGHSQKKYTCLVMKDEFLIYVFSNEELTFLKNLIKLTFQPKNILFPNSSFQGMRKIFAFSLNTILKMTLKKFFFSSVKQKRSKKFLRIRTLLLIVNEIRLFGKLYVID